MSRLRDNILTPAQLEAYTLAEVYIDKVFNLKPGKKDFTELWQNIKKKMVYEENPGWYVQSFNDAVKYFFGRVTATSGTVLSYNFRSNYLIAEIFFREKDGENFMFTVRELATGKEIDIISISPDSRSVTSKNGYIYKQVPAMVNVQTKKIIVADTKKAYTGDQNGTPIEPGKIPAPGVNSLPWYVYAAGAFLLFKVLK
ncbi:MAG: hypothetical protein L6Q47_02275 [Ignavibacteriaceae bacterium]|nr:hypothetical protein [Ignavibacteriaceae bacterium]